MKERVERSRCLPSHQGNEPMSSKLRRLHKISIDRVADDCKSSHDKLPQSPVSPTLSESSSVSSSSPVPSSKKYTRREKIGQGAQGSVYRCIENATGNEVAVKVIMTHELSLAEIEAIKREVKTIKRLHHHNLVEYYKATEKKSRQLSIYMEFVAGGSLSSKLRRDGALSLILAKKYTRQLCEALRFLHQNRIAHRDIKCANIFLTSSGENIKLGDFGAFKEVGSISLVGGLKGTPHWMAPEVIRAEQQTSEDGWFKADIWSLGCAVIEMLTGHSPWQQYSNPLTAMYQIVSSDKTPSIPADATEETASFLSFCLQRNPEKRASVSDLLNHPFVDAGWSLGLCDLHDCHTEPEKRVKPEQGGGVSNIRLPDRHHLRGANEDRCNEQVMTLHESLRAEMGIPHGSISSYQHEVSPKLPLKVMPPATRPSLRKHSVITRLKPLELIQSPSNQEGDTHSPSTKGFEASSTKPVPPIARGSSTGTLEKRDMLPQGTSRPVRLRRLSTAPTPTRDSENLLVCVPTNQKIKLPPLSARPASSTVASGGSFHM